MVRLDLSENTLLAVAPPLVEIHDVRDVHRCNDVRLFYRIERDEQDVPKFTGVLCRMFAARLTAEGERVEVTEVSVDYGHAVYGRKVVEGTATYADGVQEDWRLRVDPITMRFEWIRQVEDAGSRLIFECWFPRQHDTPEYWHTGRGAQIARGGAVEHFAEVRPSQLDAADEVELIFMSPHPKNSCRLELPGGGNLAITSTTDTRAALPGEPDRPVDEAVWRVSWTAQPGAAVYLNGTWGVASATRDFQGRMTGRPADASQDFAAFYTQVYAHCVGLNIIRNEDSRLWARRAVLESHGQDVDVQIRDIVWACEFLYLVEHTIARALLRSLLEKYLDAPETDRHDWPRGYLRDDSVAELLMAAGRNLLLTGEVEGVRRQYRVLRRCASHLLSLRRPGEALPITTRSWDAQGRIAGKEPYFTALCFAALNRMAYMAEALGDMSDARQWRLEAEAIQDAANMPYRYGGLWHPERNIYINHLDYRAPGERGPRPRNWQEATLTKEPAPWPDVALYENVVPFWLGLPDDPQLIEAAYEWIDSHYSYARGRGGADFPPYIRETFITLLDVCVRQRHGIPGAEHLYHSIVCHAFDSGAPFTRAPFGGQMSVHPNDYAEIVEHTRRFPAGMFLDNSPFFGLVLHLHYGLDYAHQGWYIGMPRPLHNYPLTRVTNLRHGGAVYAVTWQGRGKVKRVLVNGKPHKSLWLDAMEGQHEVIVQLG
jgi:hypothetical protein